MLIITIAAISLGILLLLDGVAVGFAFGLAAFILCLAAGISIDFVMPIAYQLLRSFIILALPLYILAGLLMGSSGIANKLIDLFTAMLGRFRGGLGVALIITNAIFGAVSGAATSAVGALGPVVIPRMERDGYPRGYAVALMAVSSVLSTLIPPSLSMIIFGITAQLPITHLFLTTLVPGLLLVVAFIIINMIMCKKMTSIKVTEKMSFKESGKNVAVKFGRASLGLFLPVIILGGIYGGIFTPTEAAAVGILYCLSVGFLTHRSSNFTIKSIIRDCMQTVEITGAIIVVFIFLFILGRSLIVMGLPDMLLASLTSISSNKIILFILLNIIMFIIGMITDDASGLLVAALIILPVARELGMNPLQFGAVAGVNVGMGLVTPPVAPMLYMTGRVGGNVPLKEYLWPSLAFVVFGYLPVLILTTYVPAISLFLPELFFGVYK